MIRQLLKGTCLFFLLTVSVKPAGRQADPAYLENLLRFHVAFDRYERALLGCPAGGSIIIQVDCNPKLGTVAYAAYLEAQRYAKRVF